MLALVDDKQRPRAAHPSVWAPFVVLWERAHRAIDAMFAFGIGQSPHEAASGAPPEPEIEEWQTVRLDDHYVEPLVRSNRRGCPVMALWSAPHVGGRRVWADCVRRPSFRAAPSVLGDRNTPRLCLLGFREHERQHTIAHLRADLSLINFVGQ